MIKQRMNSIQEVREQENQQMQVVRLHIAPPLDFMQMCM